MNRICVFCGSGTGRRPEYLAAAADLGRALVERGLGLVYGGASVGLMGQIARTVVSAGGEVIGVIPRALASREVAFEELPDLRLVDSMHERKAIMAELSDGFIALPGGLGTAEELLEVLTWAQLGFHDKPCGLQNVAAYFDGLIAFLDRAVEQGFMMPEHRTMVLVGRSAEELLDRFESYAPPRVDKARWARGLEDA